MRIRSFVFSLVAGVALLTSVVNAQAQPGAAAAQSAGGQAAAAQTRQSVPVAVIDLAYILNNHPTMKGKIDAIKTESEAVAKQFEDRRKAILQKMERMRAELTEGTPAYQKMEQEIAAEDTQFRLDVVRKNKEFDEKRAVIFAEVHGQVTGLVKYYCEYAGTLVVLKVSREPVDIKKPSTIETAMMQEVFYHNPAPHIDITEWVLGRLKEAAPATTGAGAAAPAQTGNRVNPAAPRIK